MITYAQNFEDVILNRALSEVHDGFFVDIGACFPDVASVTKYFYEKGWSGINVEPIPKIFDLLLKDRPRDINLNFAVGDVVGQTTFYLFEDEFGSSTTDLELANKQKEKDRPVSTIQVQTTTLNEIFKQYVGKKTVHFLKVDVEGGEGNVIRSLDLSEYRPWIIVLESMAPWSQISTHEKWEPYLLSHDYHFVYADGLNRFYLAAEQSQLKDFFIFPPNVFDDFISIRTVQAEARAWQAEIMLNSIYASRSWRITAPLRAVLSFIRKYGKH